MSKSFTIILMFFSLCLSGQEKLAGIPPVDVMVDSAIANSKIVRQLEALKQAQRAEIDIEKTRFLNKLSIKTGAAVGTGGINLNQEDALSALVSTSQSYRYDAGIYLSISPGDWIIRKKTLNRQRAMYDFHDQKLAEEMENIRLTVIEKHQLLLLAVSRFEIYNKLYESSLAVLLKSQQQFENGEIELIAYADIQLKAAKMHEEFEVCKNQLKIQREQLEILTGLKLEMSQILVLNQ